MTDLDAGAAAPEGQAAEPPGIRILAQFVRDFSFENPRAPDALRAGAAQPQIDLGVEMNARGRTDGLFEVDLKLLVTATRDGKAVFHLELLYGGLFGITGVAEDDLEAVLLIECPRYLFPFARRIISDTTADGGFFPPFQLAPLDFAAIYLQRKAQQEGQVVGQA